MFHPLSLDLNLSWWTEFNKKCNCMICFRIHTGGELLQVDSQASDALLKKLWHHSDAIMCCSLKTNVMNILLLNINFFFVSYGNSFLLTCLNFIGGKLNLSVIWFLSYTWPSKTLVMLHPGKLTELVEFYCRHLQFSRLQTRLG